jgi:Protein of unknown function (DUF5818)
MRRFFIIAVLALSFTTLSIPADALAHSSTGPSLGSSGLAAQNNNDRRQPSISTFTGTIAKNGDQFVLNESGTHKLYELDDQKAASKFADKNVTITGTLDTVKNIIRIQSIAEAAA